MTWQEKLHLSTELFAKARLIAEKGEEAEAAEKEHMVEMLKDAQKLKAEGMQLKTIDDAKAEMGLLLQPGAPGTHQALGPGGTVQVPAEGIPGGMPTQEKFDEWNQFLWAVWANKAHGVPDARLKWFADTGPEGLEGKALSGNVGARGGFLIPVQFLATLMAVMAEEAIVRSKATIIRMSRRQVAIPVLDQTGALGAGIPNWFGGMRFYWADEGQEKTETDASFRRINLVAKKLIGHTNASDELLDDSAISLADFLGGPLGFAGGIAWMEDYAFLRGTGGGQPRGIVNAPVTLAPTRVLAGSISYVDCINMLEQFLPSGRGVWVVTQRAMSNLIQMSGPAGNASYVWQPNAREGPPGMLFGMPVIWSEKMAPVGTRGDILLADFRYYLLGDRQATTIESSQFPRWIHDETTWRAVHRVDGQPWLSAPLTYQDTTTQVSPFVVLSATQTS